MVSGYEVCCIYRALKLHFTSSYDYVKYSGKLKYDREKFDQNKHKASYEKLGKNLNKEEVFNYILSNYLENDNIWIQELTNNAEYKENYLKYQKRIQSLSYVFQNECINTFDGSNNILKCENGQFPILFKKLLQKDICMETVIIMDRNLGFLRKWKKNVKDDLIFPSMIFKIEKYGRLLQYDNDKFRMILKRVIQNNIL